MSWQTLREHLAVLAALAANGSDIPIRKKMKEIIPEYQYGIEFHAPPEPRRQPPADCIPDLVATAQTTYSRQMSEPAFQNPASK
jgi:hypothetical protein